MPLIGITVPATAYDTPSRSGVALATIQPGDLVPIVSTFTNSEGAWSQVELPGWGSDMMGNPMAQAAYVLTAEVQAAGGAIVPISEVGNTPTPIGQIYTSGLGELGTVFGLPATLAGIPTVALVLGAALVGLVWMTHRPSTVVVRR